MAEKSADLRQAQRERIARREARAHVGRFHLLRRKPGAVDRSQNFAFDRQSRLQPLDIRPAASRAFKMQNESLCSAQDWPFPERPDMRPGGATRALPRVAPHYHVVRPRHQPGRSTLERMTDRANPNPASPSPAPLPISATVICKNEEACIGKCLSSLEGLAEIVVVDFGSTDGTLAIVEDFSRRGLPIGSSISPARLRPPEAVRTR